MKRNIMMDVAFTIETEKDFDTLTKEEIIIALESRIKELKENWSPDAIGYCDEYEIAD